MPLLRQKKKIGSGNNARTQGIRLDPRVQARYAQVRPHVQYAAQRYNIDEQYLAGLMYLESMGFRADAQSPSGAAGLGQFTRGTFRDVVRRSSHPELQALRRLSDNQLMLRRFDPRTNTLATAEYIGQAYQGLKRGFARYGIQAEPTRAELYSFHNTGNAGIAIAARQGLTVGQAPIMNNQQKADAISWNPSLYSNGMQTPAAEYMRRVEEKLARGAAYVEPPAQLRSQRHTASDDDLAQWAAQTTQVNPRQLWASGNGLNDGALKDYVAGDTPDIQQRVEMGQLTSQGSGLQPLSDEEMSAQTGQGVDNNPTTQDRNRAIQEWLRPSPNPLDYATVKLPGLDKMRKPGEMYFEPIDQAAINRRDRQNARFIAGMSWAGGVASGALATTTYNRGGTAAQVDAAATVGSLFTAPAVAARVRPQSVTSMKPTGSIPSTVVARSVDVSTLPSNQSRSYSPPAGMLGATGQRYPNRPMHKDYLDPKFDESKIHIPGVGGPVRYLNEHERKSYEVFVKGGRLHDSNGRPFDSSTAVDTRGNNTGMSMFVMSPTGQIYVTNTPREFHFHHSSFLAGQPVGAAGEIKVINGRLDFISNKSGHYRPTLENHNSFVQELRKRGVAIPEKIEIID